MAPRKPPSRRDFLRSSLTAMSVVSGCSDDGGAGSGGAGGMAGASGSAGAAGAPGIDCADPFAGGQLLGTVPFVNEGGIPLNTALGQGWDGRLYYDLTELSRETLITPTDKFYLRTFYPDLLDDSQPWRIAVDGLVEQQRELSIADIEPLVADHGVQLLECSGNGGGGSFGLLSAARWTGAAIDDVLELVTPRTDATRVLVSGFDEHSVPSAGGHSTPGASWVFSFDQLSDAGAFLATGINGEPLPRDRGAPVRLFVPGWFGCSCIKWVNRITLVDDAEPATAQMKEFASRTHQPGVPELARDYLPARIQQTAMPVRVERWQLAGETTYRIWGILWGGTQPTGMLSIHTGEGDWQPVDVCPPTETNATWTLWSHAWRPSRPGTYTLRMRVDDPSIPTIRLDSGWYERDVSISDA